MSAPAKHSGQSGEILRRTLTPDATAGPGAVSVWCAAVSAALLAFGFTRSRASVRYAGLGSMLVAVGKALTYDIAQLSPPVRVACFTVLEMVLLGIAGAYLKVANSQQDRPENGEETTFRRPD